MGPKAISSASRAQRNKIIEAHRKLILEIRDIEEEISKKSAVDADYSALENERNDKLAQVEPLIEEYWNWIPAIRLSQCPFCHADLLRRFDPIDLNGFWWMDRTQRPVAEPKSCEHFRLLLGAVDRGGTPHDGLFDCFPGPESPYVIPRILKMPTMIAVISSIPMDCGYTAYPIVYYSTESPPPRSLTQSWAQKLYYFPTEDGKTGWDMPEDTYDFDLPPWQKKAKLVYHE